MMYEEDRHWNMEKIVDWNDEFTIPLREKENNRIDEDDIEEESMMLTNLRGLALFFSARGWRKTKSVLQTLLQERVYRMRKHILRRRSRNLKESLG